MKYDIEIIRSDRRTLAIEIKSDMRVVVRAPLRMSDAEIRRFADSKAKWIETHLSRMATRQAEKPPTFTAEQLHRLADEALRDIPPRVKRYAAVMGVTYGRITIRNQRTRWGSCSSKGNLNFNCLLMLCPEAVRDYVVVHELAHRKEMNHSARFWARVEAVLPDHLERRKWLRENEKDIIGRL